MMSSFMLAFSMGTVLLWVLLVVMTGLAVAMGVARNRSFQQRAGERNRCDESR